jgi:hypothetical protein
MAWERRGSKSYYYYKFISNGNLISMYLGSGKEAQLFAAMVENRRKDRAAQRQLELQERQEFEAEFDAVEEPILQFRERVEAAFREGMTAAGFYVHRRQWRVRGKITMNKRHLIALNKRELEAVNAAVIRRLFDEDDGTLIEQYGGDTARTSEEMLVCKVSNDLHQREATRRQLAKLRADLEGPNPTAIERLLVARIAILRLYLAYLERNYIILSDNPAADVTPAMDEFYQRRLTRANRWLNSACRTLAICRNLALPAIQAKMATIELESPVVLEVGCRE